jgi:hypothetical protein
MHFQCKKFKKFALPMQRIRKLAFPVQKYKNFALPLQTIKRICIANAKNKKK